MSKNGDRPLVCREVVELVTDYLEGRLSDADRTRFEEHLTECDGCSTYVEQMREMIAALGHVPEDSLEPDAESELLAAFRYWRARR